MRDAPYTPELLEIITSKAPIIGTYHWKIKPTYGICAASKATALSLLLAFPRNWNAGKPWMFGMPSTKFEYASAKMRIVRMSAMEVRGMTVEGRCVSSAAWAMLSKPTNEMIASDTPSKSSFVCGQWNRIVWISIWGCHANKNPHTKINTSLQTSMMPTSSFNRED